MMGFIADFFDTILNFIASIYDEAAFIRGLIVSALGIFGVHRVLYVVTGFFFTRKFKPAKKQHKYAILIPARNEEAVIANLLKSIKRQDYPAELITTFVVADNCTDETARVARENGAICYERFNDAERTKGFALKFLFERIEEDFGIESFEGYFVFDSDNLLNKDYVTKMNDSFDAGEKIITSYRNTKNFDENWVASTYAIHWLRSIRFRHRARSVFRLATNIQGTGFLFANEIVKDGWKWTSLTEDRALTADAVAHGYKISYNDEAEFFDEQPTSLKIALRQRIRWSKGHILACLESGWPLFKNIFVGNCFRTKEERKLTKESFVEGIRHRLASFDVLSQIVPAIIPKTFLWLLVGTLMYSCVLYAEGINGRVFGEIFSGTNWITELYEFIFEPFVINMEPGVAALFAGIGLSVLVFIIGKAATDIVSSAAAVYVFIVERKRIKKIKFWKKVLYCITWPTFDIIYRYSMYIALFAKVTWKPIPHTSKVTIEDIENK